MAAYTGIGRASRYDGKRARALARCVVRARSSLLRARGRRIRARRAPQDFLVLHRLCACVGAPTKLTTMTATQIATPSVHACSARCAGMTAPRTVDTCNSQQQCFAPLFGELRRSTCSTQL